MRRVTNSLWLAWFGAMALAQAQTDTAPATGPVPEPEAADTGAAADPWLERMHEGTYEFMWRSAMRVDRMFGSRYDESSYKGVSGSIAPALLWDEFDGFEPRFRFNASVPLPRLNEHFNAFIGRVDPDEFVTERAQESGAFRRQYGPRSDDETLLGINYFDSGKRGTRFDAGAGIRLRFPLDPYVKGGLVFERGAIDRLRVGLRETGFWQNSEGFGATTRLDLQRYFPEAWLLRWSSSGTISQESQGVKGYSSIMALHPLDERRAIALAIGFNGEMDADVPLQDYGVKFAYRHQLPQDWLVLEVRTSLTWPREELYQEREASWGIGIGFELLFGTNEFLARPVTF